MQNDLNQLADWSRKWLLKFNSSNCKVIHFGHNNHEYNYTLNNYDNLEVSVEEKDLGIHVSNNFKFSSHISKITAKANSILGRINRTFTYKDKELVKFLYTSLVRPHLEYAVQSWSPFYQKDIHALEQVQRRATRLIPEFDSLTYDERINSLQLTTLEDRRIRGDLIEVYKIIHGIENVDLTKFFTVINDGPCAVTRGHQYKLMLPQVRTERRRNFFSVRVVNKWNKLPNDVVLSPTLNIFKTRYDNYQTKLRNGTSTSY